MPYSNKRSQLDYQNAWMKRRRTAWLIENGPCWFCGSWDRLEVDHIDPTEKISHRVWSWSADRRLAELSKCRPLCFECHTARHKPLPDHGTAQRYGRFGCRCDLCTAANTAKVRRSRAKILMRL